MFAVLKLINNDRDKTAAHTKFHLVIPKSNTNFI